jgi:hypothetical protein
MPPTEAQLKLHTGWKNLKGKYVQFTTTHKLNFNGGLGAELDKMNAKWGTPAAKASAEKVIKAATGYRIAIQGKKEFPKQAAKEMLEKLQEILYVADKAKKGEWD